MFLQYLNQHQAMNSSFKLTSGACHASFILRKIFFVKVCKLTTASYENFNYLRSKCQNIGTINSSKKLMSKYCYKYKCTTAGKIQSKQSQKWQIKLSFVSLAMLENAMKRVPLMQPKTATKTFCFPKRTNGVTKAKKLVCNFV